LIVRPTPGEPRSFDHFLAKKPVRTAAETCVCVYEDYMYIYIAVICVCV
jgi:hypothetical protein